MIIGETTALLAFFLALALGGLALITRPRKVAQWTFVAGVIALGLECLLAGLAMRAVQEEEIVLWSRWKLVLMSFVPGIWLVFSLSFSRGNALEFLRKWRLVWGLFLVVPLVLAVFVVSGAIGEVGRLPESRDWFLRVGPAPKGLHLVMLVGAVLILVNLERTLVAAVGTQRWRIKYAVMGVGVLFGARIYTSSQALLFSKESSALYFVESLALILACVSTGFSIARSKAAEIDVYPSHSVLRHSVSAMLAGVYLVIVGVLAKIVAWWMNYTGRDAAFQFQLEALLILVGVIGFGVLLLSDRVRQRIQLFVSRHFRRPFYDYRRVWTQFIGQTTSILDQQELCRAVIKLVAQTFNLLSVNVWLVDEQKSRLRCAASSTLTPAQIAGVATLQPDLELLNAFFREHAAPTDLGSCQERWAAQLAELSPDFFGKGGNRVVAPLLSGGDLLGLLSVADRVSGLRFTTEDFDLLKCIADQVAASLRNIALSKQLVQAKELEAFQAMSAFVVHDLKNTASTLSLMVQNMTAHFDKPEFRQDAIRGLTKSVEHITDLIGRLNLVRQKLQVSPTEVDLNEFVSGQLAELAGVLGAAVTKDLQPIPRVRVDREQFAKVLTNLLLNARDATEGAGEIKVATSLAGSWVCLEVRDNGCGMKPEFLSDSLFKPFQTTKKKGLGIGLFHTKMIVEAHQGRIEVQSELGRGSAFKILLPLPDSKP